MATTQTLTEDLITFFRNYYREEIGTLAQRYPNEQRAIEVDYADLFQFSQDSAEDVLEKPEAMQEHLDEALHMYDLPADIDLAGRGDDAPATVRVVNLPEDYTFYSGGFSPTELAGELLSVTGEVSKASDVYSKVVEAAFECKRCGTMSYIPQTDSGFQEPHECQGCERQGPFRVNHDQSTYKDAQKLRLQTPPEVASVAGQTIDVFVERDLAEVATVGDRVTITGVLHLEQVTKGKEKTGKFEPYMDGTAIAVDETDHTEIDIAPEEQSRIRALAAGEEGEPIELAGDSLAPKIYGHDHIKRMAVLMMVGGQRVVYPDGSADRGDFHMLLLGDPGTAKSNIVDRVEEVAPRSVGVSGKGAREAGITASAVRDDFGDSQWTLEAGAFVKANQGVVCIDELDDMPAEIRAAMLDPMSKQKIHVNKAGINATLSTEAGVIAAGNPLYGRFDEYEPAQEQFDLESNLLSRFDIIFTLTDRPDPDRDADIVSHILSSREAAKRAMKGEELSAEEADVVQPPVDVDILRKWIALAKRQPAPEFEGTEVKRDLGESFEQLRAANGYDTDAAVPVTWRALEGIVRIAEAAAKFEFSEVITARHARIATEAVGQSLQDFGKDEDGQFDADVIETGQSKKTTDTVKFVEDVLDEDFAFEEVDRDTVIEAVNGRSDAVGESAVHSALDKICKERGHASEPKIGETVKWLGRH